MEQEQLKIQKLQQQLISRFFILIYDSNRKLNQLKEELIQTYPQTSEYYILQLIKQNFESGYDQRFEQKIDPKHQKSELDFKTLEKFMVKYEYPLNEVDLRKLIIQFNQKSGGAHGLEFETFIRIIRNGSQDMINQAKLAYKDYQNNNDENHQFDDKKKQQKDNAILSMVSDIFYLHLVQLKEITDAVFKLKNEDINSEQCFNLVSMGSSSINLNMLQDYLLNTKNQLAHNEFISILSFFGLDPTTQTEFSLKEIQKVYALHESEDEKYLKQKINLRPQLQKPQIEFYHEGSDLDQINKQNVQNSQNSRNQQKSLFQSEPYDEASHLNPHLKNDDFNQIQNKLYAQKMTTIKKQSSNQIQQIDQTMEQKKYIYNNQTNHKPELDLDNIFSQVKNYQNSEQINTTLSDISRISYIKQNEFIQDPEELPDLNQEIQQMQYNPYAKRRTTKIIDMNSKIEPKDKVHHHHTKETRVPQHTLSQYKQDDEAIVVQDVSGQLIYQKQILTEQQKYFDQKPYQEIQKDSFNFSNQVFLNKDEISIQNTSEIPLQIQKQRVMNDSNFVTREEFEKLQNMGQKPSSFDVQRNKVFNGDFKVNVAKEKTLIKENARQNIQSVNTLNSNLLNQIDNSIQQFQANQQREQDEQRRRALNYVQALPVKTQNSFVMEPTKLKQIFNEIDNINPIKVSHDPQKQSQTYRHDLFQRNQTHYLNPNQIQRSQIKIQEINFTSKNSTYVNDNQTQQIPRQNLIQVDKNEQKKIFEVQTHEIAKIKKNRQIW